MLRLRGNCIADKGAAALSSAMASSALQELDVGHNQVRTLHTKLSAPRDGALLPLQGLYCSCLELKPLTTHAEAVISMNKAHSRHPPSLYHSCHTTCHVQITNGAAALLQKGTKLKKLSLFANHLGDEGASEIAEALSAGSYVHLQELDMSANDIGTLGVRRLCDVLESQAAPALEVKPPSSAVQLCRS